MYCDKGFSFRKVLRFKKRRDMNERQIKFIELLLKNEKYKQCMNRQRN